MRDLGKANEETFQRAVNEVAEATRKMLRNLNKDNAILATQ
jgi:hypothetical protein